MTFEFFNTSRLAFGSKLTAAFKQLDNNLYYALQNMDNVLSALSFYDQYKNRNFRAPVPTRGQMVARVNELFALVDDMVTLQELKYEEETFSVKTTFYTKSINRITNAVGSTSLKEGFAFVTIAPSNSRMTRQIRFSSKDDKTGGEILLFGFRIDDNGNIFLKGNLTENLRLYPQDATQYVSLTKGATVSLPYVAQEYECICLYGKRNSFSVSINGTEIVKGFGGGAYDNYNHVVIYVKKGDEITGEIESGFKINYNY